jgi:hypothetical protein
MQLAQVLMNAAIVGLTVVGMVMILTGVGSPQHLVSHGKENLKYFTVLSNLLVGFVALIALVCLFFSMTTLPTGLIVLKLISATGVMVTCLTTALLLTPMYGWKTMYAGGCLYFHLIVPLLAAVDCVLFARAASLPVWVTACAMIPVLLYGMWYLRNVATHGVEEGGKTYDFYGFLRWGWSKVPLVLVGMLGGTWAIALALWSIGNMVGLA